MTTHRARRPAPRPNRSIAMTKHRTIVFAAAALLGLAIALPLPVAAQTPVQDGARKFVDGLAEKAIAALTIKDISEKERAQRFRTLLVESFDVPAIGRFALGKYWREASELQKTEYLKLFEAMIVATYASSFGEYSGEAIKMKEARIDDPRLITVQSEVVKPGNPAIRVDWRVLTDEGSKFRVVDVVVEGISMSLTQRNDYAAVIQRNGGTVDGLLVALRDKAKRFE
ncbi:MAG: ABC transporter substrate-binding protein [Alphaproteobacteria bacterium]|nr:ABC transporter substrate-binding protein [Alphaproteobacteria bacterium]